MGVARRMRDRFAKTSADEPVPRPDENGVATLEPEATLAETFELTAITPADVTLDLVVQAIDRYAAGAMRHHTAGMDESDKARLYAGLSEIRELATGRSGWL